MTDPHMKKPIEGGPAPRYRPNTLQQKLAYLVEECGEVMAAAGKTLRHGLNSYNPELHVEDQETNRNWLLRELKDVKAAIEIVEDDLA